ncbi:MAG: hypothetical protein MI861_23200 [Pirellulales bacterium]|nr:hypothetical protein [Pirellulales bacterium]
MNESRPYQKSPFRPMLVILALIVVIPLLLCGGLLTWFFGRQSAAAKDLARRVDELREQNRPVDDPSLEAFHRSLTSDENSRHWRETTEKLLSEQFINDSAQVPQLDQALPVPLPGSPWEEEEAALALLERWESLRQSIHQLAAMERDDDRPPVRRPIVFEGIGTLLTDTQELRTMARLIELEYGIALRRGNADQSLACIQAIGGLQRSLSGEPILISQLVGASLQRTANRMLQQALQLDLLSEPQLVEVRDTIPSFQHIHSLHQLAIDGDVAMILPAFTNPKKTEELLVLEGEQSLADVIHKLRSRDGLFYLDEIEKIKAFPNENVRSFYLAADQWKQELETRLADASTAEKAELKLSFMLLPTYAAASEAMAGCAEQNNLARLAISVRLFKYRLNRWPQSQRELNEIGVDPESLLTIDDKPFGYRIEPEGVVVWGVNRRTENTIPDQPPEISDAEDPDAAWVWRLPN